MKLAAFVKYGGSTMPRLFLHHAEWALNEVRAVTEQEAEELKTRFEASFTFSDPEPKTPTAPPPPEPLKFERALGPKPAEKPDNPPAEPAKE